LKNAKIEIEFAKSYKKYFEQAKASIKTCYYPDCSKPSINSHILQKNGILSSIASPDRHLWELTIKPFNLSHYCFKKTGINEIYSFNGFCKYHDTVLFKDIELQEIDFNNYKSCILFSIRTLYNEIFRKQVVLKMFDLFIKSQPEKFNNLYFFENTAQQNLGLHDLTQIEKAIWNDLDNDYESFVFEYRDLEKVDVCVSSIFNYDTTEEMQKHKIKYGKDLDRTRIIFINFFPYKEKSILLMGYNKMDESIVKGYFYSFFRESEKKIQRKLTNLILFQCETWLSSDKFYKEKIKGIEQLYIDAINFSLNNSNERRTFDLNFYSSNFKQKFVDWKEINCITQ
jgi:hypothetical protein